MHMLLPNKRTNMNFLKRLFGGGSQPSQKAASGSLAPAPEDEKLKCDVCSSMILRKSGYALTTTQVTTNSRYWVFLLKNMEPIQQHLSVVTLPIELAAHTSPWLVCESCSRMFDFDRSVAKDCAIRNAAPPNSGPADVDKVRHTAIDVLVDL